MTPKEVMRASMRFDTPDRLPVLMGALGYSDAASIGLQHRSERSETGAGLDEWGCRWERTDMHNMGQVKGHPIKDLSAVADYPFPDPHDPEILVRAGEVIRKSEKAGCYVMAGQFMILFERMHSLVGFQRVLEGLYLEPELLALLADRLVEYDVKKISMLGDEFGNKIHCYTGTDDWGTQIAPFINPKMWREFFLPRYKKIFDTAHSYGWDVRLHTCGKVNDLVDLMLEAGVNSLNLQQPRAYGIEEMGRRFRGRLCFDSLCDIQKTLPTGREKEIMEEACLLLDSWAAPEGGFVLSDYGDGEAIGAGKNAKRVMLRAFLEKDPYSAASGIKNPAWAAL